MIKYSYEDLMKDIKENNINWEFDTIIGIARGGLTLSHLLSEKYDIRKCYTINAISYNEQIKNNNILIENLPNLSNSKNILLVDDITDSGDTMKSVINFINHTYSGLNIKTLTIFKSQNSGFHPNYFYHKSNEWVEFFWNLKDD